MKAHAWPPAGCAKWQRGSEGAKLVWYAAAVTLSCQAVSERVGIHDVVVTGGEGSERAILSASAQTCQPTPLFVAVAAVVLEAAVVAEVARVAGAAAAKAQALGS